MQKLLSADDTSKLEKDEHHKHIFEMMRLTGLAKVQGVCDFIETLIENQVQFLLFAVHLQVIEALTAYLAKKKVPHVVITGAVPVSERTRRVEEF